MKKSREQKFYIDRRPIGLTKTFLFYLNELIVFCFFRLIKSTKLFKLSFFLLFFRFE